MEYKEFKDILKKGLKDNNININFKENQILFLFEYMKYILEKNKSINLTAITDETEFIYKHYIDSLFLVKYIEKGQLLDIGTGAGFPGIPLLVSVKDLRVSFLDSRNKKLLVIKDFIEQKGIKNANFIHARAELLHKDKTFKTKYDYITTRAVSNINTVIRYSLPYLKEDGLSIAMRGFINEEESQLISDKKEIKEVLEYSLIDKDRNEHNRSILFIKKQR